MSEVANQVSSDEVQLRTLDAAIKECDGHILRHKVYSWIILVILIAAWFVAYKIYKAQNDFDAKQGEYFAMSPMSDGNHVAPATAAINKMLNEVEFNPSKKQ